MSKEVIDLASALIDIPSISGEEANVLDFIENHCREMGMSVLRQRVADNRWNLYASFGTPSLWFTTHIDTVPP